MKKRNLLALILAGLMLLPTLAACSADDDTKTPTETTVNASADTTTAPVTETEIAPNFEKPDFGGRTFTIVTSDWRTADLIGSEDGDILSASVSKRNLTVENDLNITLNTILLPHNEHISLFQTNVNANDAEAAGNTFISIQTNILPLADYCYDVSDLPYIDLEQPWWDDLVMEQTAFGGKNHGLTGDINFIDDHACWCMMFNMELAVNVGYSTEDIYQLVKDKKWTLDKLHSLCTDIGQDLNGDTQYTPEDDRWGLVTSPTSMTSLIWSFGGSISTMQKDGKLELTLDSTKTMEILSAAYKLYHDEASVISSSNCLTNGSVDWTKQFNVFKSGRGLFLNCTVDYTDKCRDMEDDFGVLPNPMYNENQESYITTMQEWLATMWVVPSTVSADDLAFTSQVLEWMGYRSMEITIPIFREVVLGAKAVRDQESADILDLVFESRTKYDYAYTMGWVSKSTLGGWFDATSDSMASNIASLMTSLRKTAEDAYEKALD